MENNDFNPAGQEFERPREEAADNSVPPVSPEQNGNPYAKTARAQSPFANGPYTTGYRPDSACQQGYVPPIPPQRPRKKGSGRVWKTILASMLVVALVISGCGVTAALVNSRWERKTNQMTDSFNRQLEALQKEIGNTSSSALPSGGSVPGSPMSSEGMTPGQIYARNVNSVVSVLNEASSGYGTAITSGSGFILSEDGYIVSNYHVVSGAEKLTVTMADGTEYEAKLIGYDSGNDVSVLKIDAEGLPCVTIGSSDALSIGDAVVAIGNPLGTLTLSQSVGYVSGKDRTVATDGSNINMLQIDAAINSGNSGGPLFNMNGEVVGITTAKYSGTTSSGASIEGIGFAIPIDDVIGIISDLRDYGYVTGAYLGVMVRDVDSDAVQNYNLPLGAYVDQVTDGYCAQAAGVQAKDIITALGGVRVKSVTELTRALRKMDAGQQTTITVYRSGSELTLDITLDEKPNDTEPQVTIPQDDENMPQSTDPEEWFNYFAPFFGFGSRG